MITTTMMMGWILYNRRAYLFSFTLPSIMGGRVFPFMHKATFLLRSSFCSSVRSQLPATVVQVHEGQSANKEEVVYAILPAMSGLHCPSLSDFA